MTKHETASYLVNLIMIMESKEDAGITRGTTLVNEYNKVYGQFHDLLKKEHENDEKRKESTNKGEDR